MENQSQKIGSIEPW